jgi:hypothetical protein
MSDQVLVRTTQVTCNISSISRSAGVVTMVLSSPMPSGTKGTTLLVSGVKDNTYNGTWTVSQPNPSDFTTWTYVCGGSNSSSTGGKAKTTYSDYKDKIRVSFLNGNRTSTFSTLLAAGTSWKSTDLCLGRTLAYVQMGYDETVFPSSIPNVSFVIDGKNNIWDPRNSTYGFTKNPALIIADYLCMPTTQGGFGLSMGIDVPAAALIAAANKCDEQVALNAGGYTNRYTCNTSVMLNQGRGTTLRNLLSSCAGRISYQGGQYSIQPGQWVAPTLSLTDADLVGPIQYRPRLSIRDACNAVKGVYVSPENAYQQADVPAYMQDVAHGYVSDPWLAEDNGERIFRETNFPCTDSSAIAQRLEKICLLRTRFQGRSTIRCSLKAYQAVALDTIQLSHAHYGWVNKTFEVTASRFVLDKSGETPVPVVELDIAETDSSIYDWNATEQLTPQGYVQPNNVGARVCSPPEQVIAYSGPGAVVNGITCPSTITTRADGTVNNGIYVEWTTPNDGHVVHGGHLEVQFSMVGSNNWGSFGKIDPSVNNTTINGVSDTQTYYIQPRAVNSAGVPSDWVQATPYPVVVSTAVGVINPITITFPRPIGVKPPVLPNPGHPTLDDLMPLGQWADNTVQNGHILIQNPNFAAGPVGWNTFGNAGVVNNINAGWMDCNYYGQITPASNSYLINQQQIPVAQGDVASATCYALGTSANGSPAAVMVAFYKIDGTYLTTSFGNNCTSNGMWSRSRFVATAPATAAYAQVGFQVQSMTTGQWQCGGFAASCQANSVDEVPDGSSYKKVAAPHVAAGGILQYTSGGTIDSLKPAQAGADVTAQNANILLQNPNFANGSAGWYVKAGWAIVTGTPAVTGSTNIAQYSSGTHSLQNLQPLICGPGSVIAASAFIQCASGTGSPVMSFIFYDSNGVVTGGAPLSTGTVPIDGNWHAIRLVYTAPAGAASVIVGVYPSTGTNGTTGIWNVSGFSAALLANSVDEIPDGSTYGRSLSARLSFGKPLIDFSEAIHLNKTLDNVGDGSGRFAAAEASANVTLGHALTSQVAGSGYTLTTSFALLPNMSWNTTTLAGTDIYNVMACVNIANQSATTQTTVSVEVLVDGSINKFTTSVTVPPGVYNFVLPIFCSFSGLSATPHTIALWGKVTAGSPATMISTTGTYGLCQRVF